MTDERKICGGPGCREPLTSIHGNAIYHSALCRDRYNKLIRHGEIPLKCPRCGRGDWVLTVDGDNGCLCCGYSAGDTLSLDGVRIFDGKHGRG